MSELSAALKLSRARGVGASHFKKLMEQHCLPSVALSYFLEQTRSLDSKEPAKAKMPGVEQIEKTLAAVASGEIKGTYYMGPQYPVQLADLGEPPPVVFWKGNLPVKPFAAVVGSRRPDASALKKTIEAVEALVEAGFTIISGGASGIDAMAHRTAIERGNPTVAVLGNGLDIVYPKENQALFEMIEEKGALFTELMLGAKPIKSFFPTRNRIIAALADLVVVVQAGEKSGSLITASWTARLGRRLMVVKPADGFEKGWEGSMMLVKSGAEVFSPDTAWESVVKVPVNLADRIEEFFSGRGISSV